MRLEYKYLVPNELLPELRAMIAPFVEADRYSSKPTGYTVRSIYFDTATLDCYHDKMAGLRVRRKIRIRGYNEYKKNNIVFLEIKRKYGMSIAKNRAPVAYECIRDLFVSGDVEQYVLNGEDSPNALEDASRFFFHVYRGSLRPIVLIIYEREAYYSKFGSLRITLDKNLRSSIYPSTDALFSEDGILYSTPRHFILELKFGGGLPSWLKPIIATLGLRQQALSKYIICVDRHDILNGFSRRSTLAFSHTIPHFGESPPYILMTEISKDIVPWTYSKTIKP
jgi:hypothetical protein